MHPLSLAAVSSLSELPVKSRTSRWRNFCKNFNSTAPTPDPDRSSQRRFGRNRPVKSAASAASVELLLRIVSALSRPKAEKSRIQSSTSAPPSETISKRRTFDSRRAAAGSSVDHDADGPLIDSRVTDASREADSWPTSADRMHSSPPRDLVTSSPPSARHTQSGTHVQRRGGDNGSATPYGDEMRGFPVSSVATASHQVNRSLIAECLLRSVVHLNKQQYYDWVVRLTQYINAAVTTTVIHVGVISTAWTEARPRDRSFTVANSRPWNSLPDLFVWWILTHFSDAS